MQIEIEKVRQFLRYDPETGALYWLPRGPEHFRAGRHTAEHSCGKWNARWAGAPALNCVTPDTGYRVGTLEAKRVYAHRAAFALMTGRWPGEVDHINGDRADNRWSNLREATRTEQRQNVRLRSDNQSGCHGVSRAKKGWRARIVLHGKERHLGVFQTKCEAIAARRAAEVALSFHPNHGRR